MKKKKVEVASEKSEPDVIEFVLGDAFVPSSAAMPAAAEIPGLPEPAIRVGVLPAGARSPAFELLSMPELPELERQTRARLLMQTPTRLHFYWSTGRNPFQKLRRALAGSTGDYTLVLKLADLNRGSELIEPIEAEGNSWFDVDPAGRYRVEVGFYSTSRPFVRVMYSNVVETPRSGPSPRTAAESEWRVSSEKFAKVLNVAGFERDAFDVAMAGDDIAAGDASARTALSEFAGISADQCADISAHEIRFALLAFAAGSALEELRWKIGARLFMLLQEHHAARAASERASAAMAKHFGVEAGEYVEEERSGAVFGASAMHVPRKLRFKPFPTKKPASSRGAL